MDTIERCKSAIDQRLEELNRQDEDDVCDELPPTQLTASASDSDIVSDKDKNLDKILRQQAHLKRIIDQDNQIQSLKTQLTNVSVEIGELRKACTKFNSDAIKGRQELCEAQVKEIERFQMGQLRHIADDYSRHQDILEQRKKEVVVLKKEIEKEEKERDSYLTAFEKKLDQQLEDRRKALRRGGLPFIPTSNDAENDTLTGELHNPTHIELTSVDEYAPYGPAVHSRIPASRSGGSRATGRGRSRRRKT